MQLQALIEGREPAGVADDLGELKLFTVAREVIKHSDAFKLHLPVDIENFSELPLGYLLAEDLSDTRWVVDEPGARIIFPNPKVHNGLRAGILIVPAEDVQLA
jgi:succinylglutamate desuccinylase